MLSTLVYSGMLLLGLTALGALCSFRLCLCLPFPLSIIVLWGWAALVLGPGTEALGGWDDEMNLCESIHVGRVHLTFPKRSWKRCWEWEAGQPVRWGALALKSGRKSSHLCSAACLVALGKLLHVSESCKEGNDCVHRTWWLWGLNWMM